MKMVFVLQYWISASDSASYAMTMKARKNTIKSIIDRNTARPGVRFVSRISLLGFIITSQP